MTYDSKHYRNLSATGFDPIIQRPQVTNDNYEDGPAVFSHIGSIAAPMVFGGGSYNVTQQKKADDLTGKATGIRWQHFWAQTQWRIL